MMEMVVFAITLVLAQVLAGIALLAMFMTKWFLRFYTKKVVRIMKNIEDIIEEMEDEE